MAADWKELIKPDVINLTSAWGCIHFALQLIPESPHLRNQSYEAHCNVNGSIGELGLSQALNSRSPGEDVLFQWTWDILGGTELDLLDEAVSIVVVSISLLQQSIDLTCRNLVFDYLVDGRDECHRPLTQSCCQNACYCCIKLPKSHVGGQFWLGVIPIQLRWIDCLKKRISWSLMCPMAPRVQIAAITTLFHEVQSLESVRIGIRERVDKEVV